ncbi:MAG: DUF3857 domain-containing protein [Fodinibius sp.]|nr:DUF3857 domain-containing protein [Fodinibius sp.]
MDRFTAVLLVLLVALAPGVFAQSVPDARFGVIPDSLYQMDRPAGNPDAPYVITNKELDVSFKQANNNIIAVLEHHVRMKVFEDTVREASIVAIPYYYDDSMEQISDIRAYTHLPSGRRRSIVQSDIRTINVNSRYNVKEFVMPAVRVGAILEYSYVIERRYIEELPDFFLSHRVPTLTARMTITYPKYLRYESYTEDFDGSVQNDFVYEDTSSVPKIFTIPQPPPVVTERWMARDIAPVEQESYISTLDDHRAKLKFLLSEFGIPRQQLENSWQVVVARIREKTNPWLVIKNNTLAKAKGDSIAQSMTGAPRQAVQDSIFRYLNERMNFSDATSPRSTQSDRQVLAGDPSDQAAINQTLVAMLRGADIEASPVLISTRESGQVNMDFPSFYQFNGQVVQSHIGDRRYLMDASFGHSQPGLIPVDANNGHGLVLGADSYEWLDLNPQKSNFDIDVDIDAQLQSDGTLVGTVRAEQSGYPAQLIRQQQADGTPSEDILKRILFDGYPQITTDSVRITNVHDYGGAVKLSARFEIENYATSFTDGLKFRPLVVGYQRENPFEDTDRNYPIVLDAPEKLDLSYSIELPEGYAAPDRRNNQTLSLPGAKFQEIYNTDSRSLEYEYHIDISRKEVFHRFVSTVI